MSDRLTIRLSSGAEAPSLEGIDEAARRHGMSTSQWVRSLIARELKLTGHSPERPADPALTAYAAARSDAAVFAAHLQFEQDHPSARDAHLRPRAPRRPSVMRVRVSISADEALALDGAGRAYDMTVQQVATIVLRRWIGMNKKPSAHLFGALTAIRSEIRRIGINVNQLAHAANKLLNDPRLRRQDDLMGQLEDIHDLKVAIDGAMASIGDLMGLDQAFWSSRDARPSDGLDMLPHPSIETVYSDDDPP